MILTERNKKEAYCLNPRYIEKLFSLYHAYPDDIANNYVKKVCGWHFMENHSLKIGQEK